MRALRSAPVARSRALSGSAPVGAQARERVAAHRGLRGRLVPRRARSSSSGRHHVRAQETAQLGTQPVHGRRVALRFGEQRLRGGAVRHPQPGQQAGRLRPGVQRPRVDRRMTALGVRGGVDARSGVPPRRPRTVGRPTAAAWAAAAWAARVAAASSAARAASAAAVAFAAMSVRTRLPDQAVAPEHQHGRDQRPDRQDEAEELREPALRQAGQHRHDRQPEQDTAAMTRPGPWGGTGSGRRRHGIGDRRSHQVRRGGRRPASGGTTGTTIAARSAASRADSSSSARSRSTPRGAAWQAGSDVGGAASDGREPLREVRGAPELLVALPHGLPLGAQPSGGLRLRESRLRGLAPPPRARRGRRWRRPTPHDRATAAPGPPRRRAAAA